ncbi:MAG TPA: hypothetical protein DCR43_05365 [Bacteroidales bacterium]|nr:MAG: hypothetical protein A2X11_03930 [Bacteroidetes bacterium GWE2_42_24]OFY26091.1 MAG: hypothetical protein A2X09_11575 [Bacteroidetes bacterium GWF2_43_11]HAQ65264.1 hypothetical protein [Bacteroidales bacterium]HBZ65403.1 hypothetical protein [Bacteroidales bacterium]
MLLNILQQPLAGLPLQEWIGYLASLMILIGMTMNSVRRLRWINLGGNVLFACYGFLIGSLPVGLMNTLIGMVNIFYLTKLYNKKESFRLLPVQLSNRYLKAFLEFYQDDINKFFPGFKFNPDMYNRAYVVLRDMTVASVILGNAGESGTLRVELDYAIAAYRDMKPGGYAFGPAGGGLSSEGFKLIQTVALTSAHEKYLKKCGFAPNADKTCWQQTIG